MSHGKRYRRIVESVDRMKEYSIEDAMDLIRKSDNTKFDETIEVALNLGVDPRHADQNIRVTTSLPHGSGKKVSVLALGSGSDVKDAEEAGADFFGSDEFLSKLESGWDDADVIVAAPEMMPKLGKLGKILGPKGLMPNPKSGTVTKDLAKAVKEIKAGRVELRVDKNGIIHVPIGKKSFDSGDLIENFRSVLTTVIRAKPSSVKGTYLKKITISSTMGPGIKIDGGLAT
ncbi:MAG: 50S ribosomal protein L1 [Candidatus Marinimicrobia bacterium]|nr:50S ribosomal protein L1 [Candidatus Neomarinimicrobiota bacterium]|tara:strand:+ start:1517 stop:2206 length:690 start_codon:yes stop_codon:yes gene_type:complete